VATLGDPCDTPAELACAGNHQKVTLICGGEEWEVNQTCGVGEFCNSTPGPDAGLCAPEIEACAGLEPGTRFCDSDDLVECGPDNMDTPLVESCELGCYAGHCAEPGYEPDPCPDPPAVYNCANDCGGPIQDCPNYDCTPSYVLTSAIYEPDADELPFTLFRVQVPDEPCTCGEGVELAARVAFHANLEGHILVPEPWHIAFTAGENYSQDVPSCVAPLQCVSNPAIGFYQIFTTDPDAPPINIVLESGPCP
jgi:hypothetical protein